MDALYYGGMTKIAIEKKKIEKQGGMVILSLKEYQKLLRRTVPTYHLTGREAKKLDKLVEEGLRDYRAGRTKKIRSLADLD